MNHLKSDRERTPTQTAVDDHRVAHKFLHHIDAEIAANRARFDMLQSLRDKLAAELEKDWAAFWQQIDSAARAADTGAPEEKSPVAKQPVSRLHRGRVARLAKEMNCRLRKAAPAAAPAAEPKKASAGTQRGAIVTWMQGCDGAFTSDYMRQQLPGVSRGTLSSVLDRLLKSGAVERTARSTYRWVGGANSPKQASAKEAAYRELREGMNLAPVPEVKTSLDR